jgi:hypothetical protein
VLQEFRRIALGPIFAAAAMAAILGAIVSAMTVVGDSYRATLIPASGAVGGLIGAALLLARVRVEERRRAADVLRISLVRLATSLESDANMIMNPNTDEVGKLTWNSHLSSYTGRATRTVQQIVALSVPAAIFSDDLNRDIELLRQDASAFTIFMDDVHRAARANPATVQQFHATLGPLAQNFPAGVENIRRLISAIKMRRV